MPLEGISEIATAHSAIGTQGAEHVVFYAEVDASMQREAGGGLLSHGECIEVLALPVAHTQVRACQGLPRGQRLAAHLGSLARVCMAAVPLLQQACRMGAQVHAPRPAPPPPRPPPPPTVCPGPGPGPPPWQAFIVDNSLPKSAGGWVGGGAVGRLAMGRRCHWRACSRHWPFQAPRGMRACMRARITPFWECCCAWMCAHREGVPMCRRRLAARGETRMQPGCLMQLPTPPDSGTCKRTP